MIQANIPAHFQVSTQQFEQLAIANRDLRLEMKHDGELIVMPPTGGETGNRNGEIFGQLWWWNRQSNLGKVFDSSTGFRLPNGAIRAPDTAWVSQQKWNNLTPEQKKKFSPICPEFVVELRSPSDNLKPVQEKMFEYMENGAILGWLIDPIRKKIEIYRQGKKVEILDDPQSVSGENVLPGFSLDLTKIW